MYTFTACFSLSFSSFSHHQPNRWPMVIVIQSNLQSNPIFNPFQSNPIFSFSHHQPNRWLPSIPSHPIPSHPIPSNPIQSNPIQSPSAQQVAADHCNPIQSFSFFSFSHRVCFLQRLVHLIFVYSQCSFSLSSLFLNGYVFSSIVCILQRLYILIAFSFLSFFSFSHRVCFLQRPCVDSEELARDWLKPNHLHNLKLPRMP